MFVSMYQWEIFNFASNFIKVLLPVHNIQPWYVNVNLTFLVMVSMPVFSVVGGSYQEFSNHSWNRLNLITISCNLFRKLEIIRGETTWCVSFYYILKTLQADKVSIYTTNMHGTQGSADLFKPKIKSKNVPLRKNLCFFCSNDNKKGVYAESFFENFWI